MGYSVGVQQSVPVPGHEMTLHCVDGVGEFCFVVTCNCAFRTGWGRTDREALMWAHQHLDDTVAFVQVDELKRVVDRRDFAEVLKRKAEILAKFVR